MQETNVKQHAALTLREAYYIQFATLRKAHGLPPSQPVARPRRYPYPTLESTLPSSLFPSITIDEGALISSAPGDSEKARPHMRCQYCTTTRLKSFGAIIGYWGHIVNAHQEVPNDVRLQAIIHSGSLWRDYWDLCSRGGKGNNATLAKLQQTQRDDFCWMDVVGWSLR